MVKNILETTIENNSTTTNEAVSEQFDSVLGQLLEYACDKNCFFFRTHLTYLREEELNYLRRLLRDISSILQTDASSSSISNGYMDVDIHDVSEREGKRSPME